MRSYLQSRPTEQVLAVDVVNALEELSAKEFESIKELVFLNFGVIFGVFLVVLVCFYWFLVVLFRGFQQVFIVFAELG